MKTKKTLVAGVAAFAAVASANATLVAGWDFSQYVGSGFNSTNGADFVGEGNAQANYSDLLTPSPDIAAATYGSIYFDGSNGSFDGANGFASTISPFSGSLTSALVQTADLNPFDSHAQLANSGQGATQFLSLATTVNEAIVFSADVSSLGQAGSGWQLNFAALDSTDTSSITWEVSTDGVNYNSLGVTSSLTTTDAAFQVNAGATYDNEDQIFFRGTFSGVDTQALIDNVGISATGGLSVVPEPSTYAAIFGAIALAFAVSRRRA